MKASISVVIPVYNGKRFLREAVASVAAQTLLPAEVILIDDGSKDDPFTVLGGGSQYPFPIIKKKQANAGQSSARNAGAALATGEFLAFLDQDDKWYPEHLERLIRPFSPRTGWVYSNLDLMNEDGRLKQARLLDLAGGPHPKRQTIDFLRYDIHVLPSASLVRKTAFESVGGFDIQLSGFEDDDLFRRMHEQGWDNEYVDVSLSAWRIHKSSCGFSPRMAKSRDVYEAKLLAKYPEYTDAIKPRFANGRLNEKLRTSRVGQFLWPARYIVPRRVRHIVRHMITKMRAYGVAV